MMNRRSFLGALAALVAAGKAAPAMLARAVERTPRYAIDEVVWSQAVENDMIEAEEWARLRASWDCESRYIVGYGRLRT